MALYTELLAKLGEAERQAAYRYLWLRGRLHHHAIRSCAGLAMIAVCHLLFGFISAGEPGLPPFLEGFINWAPVIASVLCGAMSAMLLLSVNRQKQTLRDLRLSPEIINALSSMPVRHFA